MWFGGRRGIRVTRTVYYIATAKPMIAVIN